MVLRVSMRERRMVVAFWSGGGADKACAIEPSAVSTAEGMEEIE